MQEQPKKRTDAIPAIAVLSSATTQQDGAVPLHPALQALIQSVLEERLEQRQTKEQAEANMQAVREALSRSAAKAEAEAEKRRQDCTHRKEDGRPAVGGQRDHQQVTHYVCYNCGSAWTDETIPPGLRISRARIGGPS